MMHINNSKLITCGNNSKIIKTGSNSNIQFTENIYTNELSLNELAEFIDQPINPQPGDAGICPDGSTRIVGRDGRFYCDIDPDGDGLYPRTTVKCSDGKITSVNDRGNIISGCQPADGSEVTCLADFETIVENGTWSCAQGEDDKIRRYLFIPFSIDIKARLKFTLFTINEENKYISSPINTENPITLNLNNTTQGVLDQFVQIDEPNDNLHYSIVIYNNTYYKAFVIGRVGKIELADYDGRNYTEEGRRYPVIDLPSGTYYYKYNY